MIRINLLPYKDAKRKEGIRQIVIQLILFFVGLVIAVVLLEVNFINERGEVQKEIRETQREIDKLREVIAKVKKYEKDKQALEKKLEIMSQLQKNRYGPVRFLDDLSQGTPEKLWIESFEQVEKTIQIPSAEPNKPPTTKTLNYVDIKGAAVTFKAIADFMTNTERSDSFNNVELKLVEQFTEENLNLLRFSITCELTALKTVGG